MQSIQPGLEFDSIRDATFTCVPEDNVAEGERRGGVRLGSTGDAAMRCVAVRMW